jgi:pimeloyl-ACP methyl ester carboxylesterase
MVSGSGGGTAPFPACADRNAAGRLGPRQGVSGGIGVLLRPGNAGSSTVADHIAVLAAAVRQIPARFRSRLLVRVDGAGASHELIAHLLSLAGRRRTVLFTCGWMITEADEQAIRLLPATARQAAVDQDGTVQENRHVAEVTHLMSRAVGWPAGLRWIVRRTKPSRRQMKNLTAFERSAGWRYSDIDLEITPTALASDVAGLLDQLGIDRAHLRPQHGRRGDAGARREPSRPGALAGAGLRFGAAGRAAPRTSPTRPGRLPRRGCRPSRTSSTSRRPTSGCPRIRTTSTTSSQRCRSRPPIRKGGPGEQLATITAPTLLVLGDRDFITVGHGALMQQLIPGSQLAVLPGTTHMQVTRRADLLLPILARFLDRDPRSTAAPVRSPRGGTPPHS